MVDKLFDGGLDGVVNPVGSMVFAADFLKWYGQMLAPAGSSTAFEEVVVGFIVGVAHGTSRGDIVIVMVKTYSCVSTNSEHGNQNNSASIDPAIFQTNDKISNKCNNFHP